MSYGGVSAVVYKSIYRTVKDADTKVSDLVIKL